jgi:hypothetical protein
MKSQFYLVIVLLVILNNKSYSQDTITNKKTMVRLHFLEPGLTLEQRIGKCFSFSYDIGSGFQYYYYNVNGKSTSDLSFFPYIRFEPRYYFDLENRSKDGRRTTYLSADYLSIQFKKSFPTSKFESWYSYGAIIGFQRTFKKIGYIDLGIGYGGTTYGYDTSIGFIGNFHLGVIIINPKK